MNDDEDLEPLVGGRVVDLGRAILATAALMFLTGAAVFLWQQWANDPHPNDVDIGFAEDMQAHHNQGVTMALSYLHDGTDSTLRQMAEEIVRVQAGEVRLMGQYLIDWGNPDVDPVTAMAWMDEPVPEDEMPGMATQDQLDHLDAATGDELDDLFTELMINHHRGGIHMAQYAVDHGHEAGITDLAQAMVTTQTSEIAEMNLRRQDLGLDAV